MTETEKIKPISIVSAARSLIGTPYKFQGRTAHKELDCSGLVVVTGKIAGVYRDSMGFTNYPPVPDGSLIREFDKNFCELEEIQEGAIAVFTIAQTPYHCGILGKNEKGGWNLIHAYSNAKAVREHELIRWWSNKLFKLYGFEGVDYGC